MPEFVHINWTPECILHVAEHDVTPDEFEQVLRRRFDNRERSRTDSRNWIIRGLTDNRRFLVIVFEWIEEIDWINPVTAYEPNEEL